MKSTGLTLILGALLLWAPAAKATNLTASGEGWCSNTMGCNNTDTSVIMNTYAGSDGGGDLFQDWFAFQLPATTITNASISIFNSGSDFNADPTAVYTLFEASSFSFGGLASGTAFGSVDVSTADNGKSHYVKINLNDAGLAALNGDLNNTFVFGGSGGSNPDLQSDTFGYTSGAPVAFLTLNASNSPVPEPSTFLLLGSGLAGAFTMLRRKLAR